MPRVPSSLVPALLALLLTGCAGVPRGAYYPDPTAPATATLARALYRAAQAAGTDPARYSFALVASPRVAALSAEDGVFYFTEGLAAAPPAHVDALVAQAVAHEVLGHAGQRRTLTVGVSAGFAALGVVVPGLGLVDLLANPLIVRAFSREQEIAADRRAVDLLATMGYPAPRRTLAAALRAAAAANGPPRGGLLAREPALDARLAALEPLEPEVAAATGAPGDAR